MVIPSIHIIRKVAPTISTELRLVPKESERSSSFIPAFSFVRTVNIPSIDSNMPTAAMSIGAITALNCISTSPDDMNAAAPRADVARIEPQYDS